jgi:hypothetical protein
MVLTIIIVHAMCLLLMKILDTDSEVRLQGYSGDSQAHAQRPEVCQTSEVRRGSGKVCKNAFIIVFNCLLTVIADSRL